MKKSRSISLLISFLFACSVSAQEPTAAAPEAKENVKEKELKELKEPARKNELTEILNDLGYPELQVVPRASERLSIEAKAEDSSAFMTHWPMEIAGAATLAVSLSNKSARRSDLTDKEKKDANSISSATMIVGAGWLIGGVALGMQRPYRTGMSGIAKYNGKDDRSALLRERLAEEALEKPARVMHVLNNAAVWSCMFSNLASAWHANENGKVTAGVGFLLSMMPWFFEDHNVEVYDKHIEYKKKIYTPLKTAYFNYDSNSRSWTPMAGLSWGF